MLYTTSYQSGECSTPCPCHLTLASHSSPFFILPLELRTYIYAYIFDWKPSCDARSAPKRYVKPFTLYTDIPIVETAIFAVCRQVNIEATAIFFSIYSISAPSPSTLRTAMYLRASVPIATHLTSLKVNLQDNIPRQTVKDALDLTCRTLRSLREVELVMKRKSFLPSVCYLCTPSRSIEGLDMATKLKIRNAMIVASWINLRHPVLKVASMNVRIEPDEKAPGMLRQWGMCDVSMRIKISTDRHGQLDMLLDSKSIRGSSLWHYFSDRDDEAAYYSCPMAQLTLEAGVMPSENSEEVTPEQIGLESVMYHLGKEAQC